MKNSLRIQSQRFLRDFSELGKMGATPGGGVDRPTFSDAHLQALEWFRQYTETTGLPFRTDPAGNRSAFLDCAGPSAATLLIGSHLDSVYNGGRFDGALGVMAGLEVLQTIRDASFSLPFNLEVIAFNDEEGTLVGMLGSKALAGEYHTGLLDQGTVDRNTILTALKKGGIDAQFIGDARRDPKSLHGYLELHIEQGSRLYRGQKQIGVVSAIVGMCALRITYTGKANHAGTTGMDDRQDAGLGASAYNLAARQMVVNSFPGCVGTVGRMEFKPGGVNIIPGEAVFSVDYRSVDLQQLSELEKSLIGLAEKLADEYRLGLKAEKTIRHEPALMNPVFQAAIEKSAEDLGLSTISMPSGAGHDAQTLATLCPCGMIFVPSQEGISHSPYEHTLDEDCVNGTNVLLQTVLNLAGL